MKANVGGIDRILRGVAGVALIVLAVMGIGTPWTWLGAVALATSLISFCPLYPLLGISTSKKSAA